MSRHTSLSVAIALGGVIIALAVFYSIRAGHLGTALSHVSIRPVSVADHTLGNPTAPVRIIEYVDFESAASASLDATLRQAVANEGGGSEVALVVRELPDPNNPASLADAEAAECVGQTTSDPSVFFTFAKSLFDHQPNDPASYGTFAKAAGVPDTQAFASCFSSVPETVTARINTDAAEAKKLGATKTPFSVVLSTTQPPILSGSVYPYDAIKTVVETLLGKNGS